METAEELAQQGWDCENQGRPGHATRAYRAAIALSPSFVASIGSLANLDARRQAHESAIRGYRRGIAVAPWMPALHLMLASAWRNASERSAAGRSLRRSLVIEPAYGKALLNLVLLNSELGPSLPSIIRLRRALATQNSFEAWQYTGTMLRQLTPGEAGMRRLFGRSVGGYHAGDASRLALGRPGYLLIRPWGAGFWGDVNHVVVHLALAEIMGRIPVVFWSEESRYWTGQTANAWDEYFTPVSSVALEEITRPGQTYFPLHWTRDNIRKASFRPAPREISVNPRGVSALTGIGRDEDVVVGDCYLDLADALAWAPGGHRLADMAPLAIFRSLYDRYISATPEIAQEASRLAAETFGKRPVLAVHFRTQSAIKTAEAIDNHELTIADYLPVTDRFIAQSPDGRIFLLTDSAPAARGFDDRYGERVVHLPAARIEEAAEIEVTLTAKTDPKLLARQVMLDVYLALHADAFLGDAASAVTCAIMHLKDWPEGQATLLRENVFVSRRV